MYLKIVQVKLLNMPDWIIITIFQLILFKSNIRRQLVGQQFWRLF